MNKINMAVGAAGVVVLLAGCGPELAEVPYGAEEARWQKILRDNYSGYEAPRTAPPAIRDNVSPRLLEEEEQSRRNEQNKNNPPPAADNPPAVSDDPAAMVDKAAEQPAPKEPKAVQPAPEPSPVPAKVDAAGAAGFYEVKSGDTVTDIAQRVYGDARRSDVIISANPRVMSIAGMSE